MLHTKILLFSIFLINISNGYLILRNPPAFQKKDAMMEVGDYSADCTAVPMCSFAMGNMLGLNKRSYRRILAPNRSHKSPKFGRTRFSKRGMQNFMYQVRSSPMYKENPIQYQVRSPAYYNYYYAYYKFPVSLTFRV